MLSKEPHGFRVILEKELLIFAVALLLIFLFCYIFTKWRSNSRASDINRIMNTTVHIEDQIIKIETPQVAVHHDSRNV